jgi:NADH dehydrogenase/NADH:ubiquinone oxidoreductase subunit G
MAEYITMTIAGSQVRAAEGTPVLEAALSYGICIPSLCHVEGLTALGACRLCLVEVVENGRSKLTASCSLEAREGMVVKTDTPKLRRLRRNIAELMVAEAPNSKAIQDLAVRCGVKEVRYPFRRNDCILCGRCVRVCEELWQARAKGFVGRGEQRHVDWPLGVKPDFCKECGSCISLCPMTIPPCNGYQKPGEEHLCGLCEGQLSMSQNYTDTCVSCGLGESFGCANRGGPW